MKHIIFLCLLSVFALAGFGCERRLTTEATTPTQLAGAPNSVQTVSATDQDEDGRYRGVTQFVFFDENGRMIIGAGVASSEPGLMGTLKQALISATGTVPAAAVHGVSFPKSGGTSATANGGNQSASATSNSGP